jgi:hypothetical protein
MGTSICFNMSINMISATALNAIAIWHQYFTDCGISSGHLGIGSWP